MAPQILLKLWPFKKGLGTSFLHYANIALSFSKTGPAMLDLFCYVAKVDNFPDTLLFLLEYYFLECNCQGRLIDVKLNKLC